VSGCWMFRCIFVLTLVHLPNPHNDDHSWIPLGGWHGCFETSPVRSTRRTQRRAGFATVVRFPEPCWELGQTGAEKANQIKRLFAFKRIRSEGRKARRGRPRSHFLPRRKKGRDKQTPATLFDLPASSCRNSPTPSFVKKELGSNGTGTSINHLISPSHDEDLCLTHSRHYSTGVPRLEVGDPAVARRLLTHAGSHHGVVDGSCATPSRVRLRCV
jgi:hypothetical protein